MKRFILSCAAAMAVLLAGSFTSYAQYAGAMLENCINILQETSQDMRISISGSCICDW